MLSKKYAEPVRNILILVLIGVFSFFVVTSWLPDRDFIQDSLESVEESSIGSCTEFSNTLILLFV